MSDVSDPSESSGSQASPGYGYQPPPPPQWVPPPQGWSPYGGSPGGKEGRVATIAVSALAGVLVGGFIAFVLGFVLGMFTSDDAGLYPVSTYGSGGTYSAFDLKEGDCAPIGEDRVTKEIARDCREKGTVEVYLRQPLPVIGDYVLSEVEVFADSLCYLSFEAETGLVYADVPQEYEPLVPTEKAWRAGERDVVCLLTNREE